MAEVLSAPVLVAALVLCVAGAAKLRRPGIASDALGALGVSAGPVLVRALAACELALGVSCLVFGGVAVVFLAVVYAAFAGVAIRLQRLHQPCGCFGAVQEPSSAWQWGLSAVFALLAAAGAVWPVHTIGSIFDRPPATATATVIGLAGAAYAAVIAYTELPSAWGAWERT